MLCTLCVCLGRYYNKLEFQYFSPLQQQKQGLVGQSRNAQPLSRWFWLRCSSSSRALGDTTFLLLHQHQNYRKVQWLRTTSRIAHLTLQRCWSYVASFKSFSRPVASSRNSVVNSRLCLSPWNICWASSLLLLQTLQLFEVCCVVFCCCYCCDGGGGESGGAAQMIELHASVLVGKLQLYIRRVSFVCQKVDLLYFPVYPGPLSRELTNSLAFHCLTQYTAHTPLREG